MAIPPPRHVSQALGQLKRTLRMAASHIFLLNLLLCPMQRSRVRTWGLKPGLLDRDPHPPPGPAARECFFARARAAYP